MSKVYRQPSSVASATEADPLEAMARHAAQQMIQAALEHEVAEYLERHRYRRASAEQPFRGYRNGYGRERKLSLGTGTIRVRAPRVRDTPAEQEPFESRIVEPYQKRSRTVAALFPKLFIEGLATRDFEPALRCLLGEDAALSPSTISRLNQKFRAEYDAWQRRDLSGHRFVYIYADGVHMKAGLGHERAAMLVIYGVDSSGYPRTWWPWKKASERAARAGWVYCEACAIAGWWRRCWRWLMGR